MENPFGFRLQARPIGFNIQSNVGLPLFNSNNNLNNNNAGLNHARVVHHQQPGQSSGLPGQTSQTGENATVVHHQRTGFPQPVQLQSGLKQNAQPSGQAQVLRPGKQSGMPQVLGHMPLKSTTFSGTSTRSNSTSDNAGLSRTITPQAIQVSTQSFQTSQGQTSHSSTQVISSGQSVQHVSVQSQASAQALRQLQATLHSSNSQNSTEKPAGLDVDAYFQANAHRTIRTTEGLSELKPGDKILYEEPVKQFLPSTRFRVDGRDFESREEMMAYLSSRSANRSSDGNKTCTSADSSPSEVRKQQTRTVYQCPICKDIEFNTRDEFIEHMKTTHEKGTETRLFHGDTKEPMDADTFAEIQRKHRDYQEVCQLEIGSPGKITEREYRNVRTDVKTSVTTKNGTTSVTTKQGPTVTTASSSKTGSPSSKKIVGEGGPKEIVIQTDPNTGNSRTIVRDTANGQVDATFDEKTANFLISEKDTGFDPTTRSFGSNARPFGTSPNKFSPSNRTGQRSNMYNDANRFSPSGRYSSQDRSPTRGGQQEASGCPSGTAGSPSGAKKNPDKTYTIQQEKFVAGLSMVELRALLQDLSKRLVNISQAYHRKRECRENMEAGSAFEFFGLQAKTATLQDAAAAYKRLAKQMHPDKNGSTDEAKEAFQEMKALYDLIRKTLSPDEFEGDVPQKNPNIVEKDRKEAYDEDSPVNREKEDSTITYDPADRRSMEKTLEYMVKRMRHVKEKEAELDEEMRILRGHARR